MKTTHALACVVLAAGLVVAAEAPARACGGCFHGPPSENPTIVTDHRMVFTISSTQSTLYDQIRYSGSPTSFAWVLPYVGDVEIGLSSDDVFALLDSQTQTRILGPNDSCPPRPFCIFSSSSSSSSSSASSSGGVTVLAREVVGPYETVKLSATDDKALETWLTANGYVLPESVKPVVSAYQNEHFNFVALKLAPGKDVQDMRPVRVTTQGSNIALPLRMVAAGTGATVGITLWILAEGRYQPQNFASYQIKSEDLTWNPNTQSSDYTEIRAQKNAAGNGRIWEIESSSTLNSASLESALGYHTNYVRSGSYEDEKSDAGVVAKSAQDQRDEDVDALLAIGSSATIRVTRLRADLSHAALDQDLVLTATPDQLVLSPYRYVSKENPPLVCPTTNPPCPDDTKGGGFGGSSSGSSGGAGPDVVTVGGGSGCSTTSTSTPWGWLSSGIALFLSYIARKKKKHA